MALSENRSQAERSTRTASLPPEPAGFPSAPSNLTRSSLGQALRVAGLSLGLALAPACAADNDDSQPDQVQGVGGNNEGGSGGAGGMGGASGAGGESMGSGGAGGQEVETPFCENVINDFHFTPEAPTVGNSVTFTFNVDSSIAEVQEVKIMVYRGGGSLPLETPFSHTIQNPMAGSYNLNWTSPIQGVFNMKASANAVRHDNEKPCTDEDSGYINIQQAN